MIRYVLLILTMLSLLFSSENKKLAQTGFQFLSISSDARSGGMADAMTTIHSNSVALFFNPAGLSRQNQFFDINFSSNEWIAGIKHDAVSFSFSPKNGQYGCLGFSLLNVDYGELQGTMVWDNDQGFIDTEKFSPSALAFGIGYGRALSENFSVGAHVKKAYQYLGNNVVPVTDSSNVVEDNVANAAAFDFGTIYITDWHGFTFGMSVRNFSEEVEYAYDSFQLPLTFRVGGSIDALSFFPSLSDKQSLKMAIEALHPRSHPERVNLGLEYSFMGIGQLRLGYLFNYDQRDLTYGAGVKLGPLKIDYALTPFGVFDSVSRISIGIAR
ncbi:MAG: PorV/PorQ family protein [Candidatus Neomarinimicrobiota bacterium]